MKLELRSVELTGYSGGLANETATFKAHFKCPMTVAIARKMGCFDEIYNSDGGRPKIHNFIKNKLLGRLEDCVVLFARTGNIASGNVDVSAKAIDEFEVGNVEGAAVLKFKLVTDLKDVVLLNYIVEQAKNPCEIVKIECRQKELFVDVEPEEEPVKQGKLEVM